MNDFQEVFKKEEMFQVQKETYSEALATFLAIPISKKKARKDALHNLQASATAFFNSFERLVVIGSLCGAANDRVWYRDKAETALNLLETIHRHYAAVFTKAEALGEDLALFTPSLTAYATIERLVAENFPEDAKKWEKKFRELGLPVRGFDAEQKPAIHKTDLLLVTVNDVETQAVLNAFKAATGEDAASEAIEDRLYNNLGVINGTQVYHAISEMGSIGPGAMQQTVDKAVRALNPSSVIAIGVGFGVNENEQKIGDILVSTQLSLYDLARQGKTIKQRGDKPHASTWLINYFKVIKTDWDSAEVRVGLLLTGEKLIDDIDYRNQLLKVESEAIGGDMEGSGLYVTCLEYKIDWIVLKAICDWADGQKHNNKNARQRKAAKNASDLLIHALKKAPLKKTS